LYTVKSNSLPYLNIVSYLVVRFDQVTTNFKVNKQFTSLIFK